jgi:hypothetical protein
MEHKICPSNARAADRLPAQMITASAFRPSPHAGQAGVVSSEKRGPPGKSGGPKLPHVHSPLKYR